MPRRLIAVLGLTALAAAACTSSSNPTRNSPAAREASSSASTAGYHPNIDPSDFISRVDNPYFPLTPGTTFVYKGFSAGQPELNTVFVTHRTKQILGVTATVVHDRVFSEGKLAEDTFDWYTQDRQGNVWYFGEDTREIESGKVVSREGSWEAGVDGAQPGIFMPAHPHVTDSFREEYYRGHAEDTSWFISLNQSISVPYRSFHDAILAMEWTRLEPKTIGLKYYASGVGLVAEVSAAGPKERSQLVKVRNA